MEGKIASPLLGGEMVAASGPGPVALPEPGSGCSTVRLSDSRRSRPGAMSCWPGGLARPADMLTAPAVGSSTHCQLTTALLQLQHNSCCKGPLDFRIKLAGPCACTAALKLTKETFHCPLSWVLGLVLQVARGTLGYAGQAGPEDAEAVRVRIGRRQVLPGAALRLRQVQGPEAAALPVHAHPAAPNKLHSRLSKSISLVQISYSIKTGVEGPRPWLALLTGMRGSL